MKHLWWHCQILIRLVNHLSHRIASHCFANVFISACWTTRQEKRAREKRRVWAVKKKTISNIRKTCHPFLAFLSCIKSNATLLCSIIRKSNFPLLQVNRDKKCTCKIHSMKNATSIAHIHDKYLADKCLLLLLLLLLLFTFLSEVCNGFS